MVTSVVPQIDPVPECLDKIRKGEGNIDWLILVLNKYASGDFVGNTKATPEQWKAIGAPNGEIGLRQTYAQAEHWKNYKPFPIFAI